jgi:hypothetical protein
VSGRLGDLRTTDRRQREVAECAAAFPALVARLGDNPLGAGVDVEVAPRAEPLDTRVAVPQLASPLGGVEMLEELLGVVVGEAELLEPPACLSGVHTRHRYRTGRRQTPGQRTR